MLRDVGVNLTPQAAAGPNVTLRLMASHETFSEFIAGCPQVRDINAFEAKARRLAMLHGLCGKRMGASSLDLLTSFMADSAP